jgi:hypothetical protein
MIEKQADFWLEAEDADAIVCTINTCLKKDGTLVMGAGIAKQFAEKFEWLPDAWGIRTKTIADIYTTYPFVELSKGGPAIIGIHTKMDWRKDSTLELVERSVKQLAIICRSLNYKKVVITRPGCGNGGLSWHVVKPLINPFLDDRYVVCSQ